MNYLTAVLAFAAVANVSGVTVTVGDGTAASCTDVALDAGFAPLDNGDILEFNCGVDPHTITISSPKWTEKSVTIDGGNKIILHGQDMYRHFIFAELDAFRGLFADGIDVTVKNIQLEHGFGNAIDTGRRIADGNVTWDNPVPKHDGGSIYMGKRGTLRLSHVTITDSKTWGEPILEDDVDERNYVTFRGGGVYIGVESTGIFEDCVFERNVARMEGGAVHARYRTLELIIRRSRFCQNEASDEGKNNGGGAIFVQETFFTCEYCYFRENYAQTGGAIRNLMTETTLRHCIFSKNAANKKTTLMQDLLKPIKGGAFYVDGARSKATGENSSLIILSNCTFEENHAEKGGGVYLCLYDGDSAIIEDSRFCGNWVDNTENYVFPTGAALQRDCVGEFTLQRTHMGGNYVTGQEFTGSSSETFNDSPENVVFIDNTIPGWPTKDNVIVDPPGPTCDFVFCGAFPECCEELPVTTEPIATTEPAVTTELATTTAAAQTTTEPAVTTRTTEATQTTTPTEPAITTRTTGAIQTTTPTEPAGTTTTTGATQTTTPTEPAITTRTTGAIQTTTPTEPAGTTTTTGATQTTTPTEPAGTTTWPIQTTTPPEVDNTTNCKDKPWSAWSKCSRPCGGCGTQWQQKQCPENPNRVVFQYRVCNVCPCRVHVDPKIFRFFRFTQMGRMSQQVYYRQLSKTTNQSSRSHKEPTSESQGSEGNSRGNRFGQRVRGYQYGRRGQGQGQGQGQGLGQGQGQGQGYEYGRRGQGQGQGYGRGQGYGYGYGHRQRRQAKVRVLPHMTTSEAPCCFKFRGRSMAHQLSEVKNCHDPHVNGWYDGTYTRRTFCRAGLLHPGQGPEYIGF